MGLEWSGDSFDEYIRIRDLESSLLTDALEDALDAIEYYPGGDSARSSRMQAVEDAPVVWIADAPPVHPYFRIYWSYDPNTDEPTVLFIRTT
jgi:hypothetical protein